LINSDTVAAILLAYLMGSIPSAVWIGKTLYGIDVREYGSGNAGATNTFRVLGRNAGIPVLLLDIAKGYFALQLAQVFGEFLPGTQQFINFKLALGISALLGHIFPVFAGFRGGKGVATLTGVLLGIHPAAALICTVVFVITLLITNYVSLSSILASFVYPVSIMLIFRETIPSVNIFAISVAVLVLITHQKNIERLLNGTESKVAFLSRKSR
jgi:glycerol-3-phosphate acyltransferase PlsY